MTLLVKASRLGDGTANQGTVLCGDRRYRTPAELGGASQVNSDWNATSGVAQILNKPSVMPPTAHQHTPSDVAGTAVVTADARLSDARIPTAHGHAENILHSLATAVNDFLVASGVGAFVKKTLAEVKTILGLGTAAYTAATDYETPAGASGKVSDHAAAADPHAGYQKESEKAQVNGYASLGADGKVPSAQLPASGSDPWVYVILASDFLTSSATAVPVTGLQFTPALNKKYEFEGKFMLRTATATVGPRPGLGWPTGMTDGVASLWMTSSATARLLANGNIAAALLIAVGGLPTNTLSYPAFLEGMVVAGASPSGTVKVNLASETAGTNVTMKAGSFIKYREVA